MGNSKIIYTLTDEAPLLATCSLLPVIRTFTSTADIDIVKSDISVAARILAEFSDYLTEDQKVPDNLAELGRLTQEPDTNIIKLPNISATVPQLMAAVAELQSQGYKIPDYPEEPRSEEERVIQDRYSMILETLDCLLQEGRAGSFDMAFIDADKENYLNYYERCLELIRVGGLIMVDNVLWDGSVIDASNQKSETVAIREFNEYVHQDSRVDISLVPIGDGLTLARKR